MAGKRVIDWAAVERDYRTGQFTDRELGTKYGCSHAAIGKKARELGWEKDLSDAVRKATRAKVLAKATAAASDARRKEGKAFAEDAADPAKIAFTVEAAAAANADVILDHRTDLRETRELLGMARRKVREKLGLAPDDVALAGELAAGDDDNPVARIRSQAQAEKLLGVSQIIQDLQRLTEAQARLQASERIAFGMDEEAEKGKDTDLDRLTDEELDARINEHLARRQG